MKSPLLPYSFTARYASPLGNITLASDGNSLTGLWFDGQKHFGSTLAAYEEKPSLPVFQQTKAWLDTYFTGESPGFTPPIRMLGSVFQCSVWAALLHVPPGKTRTYGEIAAAVALTEPQFRPAAIAVGSAVARNPLSLIVPCHRIVGASGSLTGYAGGTERKLFLLKLERADLSCLFIPD